MSSLIKFVIVGFFFGIILIKSEAASWYRIFEMFHFQSFHMYGIIATAVISGVIVLKLIKYKKAKDYKGNLIIIADKEKAWKKYLFGGVFFGLGWGLAGSCPGPIYALLGTGIYGIGVVFIGALIGTFIYGVFKDKLPH